MASVNTWMVTCLSMDCSDGKLTTGLVYLTYRNTMNNITEQPFIVFDLDDTLANLRHHIHEAMTLSTGRHIPIEAWSDYSIYEKFGVTYDQFLDIIKTHQCLEKCHPEAFVHHVIQSLRDEGYRIGVMTARGWHPEGYAITLQWFELHGIHVDKLAVVCHAPKGHSIHEHFSNVAAFIDDHPKHVASVEAVGIPSWLMVRPWGQSFEHPRRIECLSVFLDEVRALPFLAYSPIVH